MPPAGHSAPRPPSRRIATAPTAGLGTSGAGPAIIAHGVSTAIPAAGVWARGGGPGIMCPVPSTSMSPAASGEPIMTLLAMVCAALAAAVALAPAPGTVRLRSVLRRHPGSRLREGSPAASVPFGPGVAEPVPGGAATANRPHHAVSASSRALAALIAGAAALWLLGGVSGVVAGPGVAAAAWYGLGRLEPATRRRDRERVVAMLPLAADLMTAALSAGCPPAVAAETVGASIGGPLGRALVDTASAASVGVEPGRAWSKLAAEPSVRPLARALTAAMTRGTSPSAVLERVSADARDAARWAGEARARSLGARAAAPLGLCFLPAFVLVGVVPIIATSGPLLL